MAVKSAVSATAIAIISLASAAPAAPPPAHTAEFGREFASFIEHLRSTPHAPPGFVVIAFHEGTTVFEQAYGSRNTHTGARMTLDTPIYNASLTKAYTGLLAAILHDEGKFPLDTTLRDVWPDLTLPAPLQASQVTAAKLLSHSSGIFDGGLQFRSNVTGEISRAAIPPHLAAYAEPRPGFRYSNFGPFLYSAMVEARTGETWHQGLKQRVLDPLGLAATTTQLEGDLADQAAQCHVVCGDKLMPVPHKPNAVLNAAGGIYATARDTAKFLKVFTTDGRSSGGKVSANVARHTWQLQSVQDVNFAGLQRDGYGLGWDLGSYDGQRYVSRSGGYYGCGSFALWLPEKRFGVAVLSVGDTAVATMNVSILMQAVDLWTGHPDSAERARGRIASFHKVVATAAQKRQAIDARLSNPAPIDGQTAARAVGVYENRRLGQAVISRNESRLVFRQGALTGSLVPVSDHEFLLVDNASLQAMPFKLVGDADKAVHAFIFDDDRYDRATGLSPQEGGDVGQ